MVKRFICLDGEKIGHVFVMRRLRGEPRADLGDTADYPVSTRGHIVLVYVVTTHRNNGYGTEALELLRDEMTSEKQRLSINVLASNQGAMHVYRDKLGFTYADTDEREFEGKPEMRQWMVLRLK